MNKKVLAMLFLVCEPLGGTEPIPEVLAKIAHKMSGSSWGQADGVFLNRICRGHCVVPLCHEKKLYLAVFVRNVLTKIQLVELKEGVFMPDTVFIKDKTSRCRAAENKKNKEELARRKGNYQFVSLKEKQEELFRSELAQEKVCLQKMYGVGTRMVRMHGESIPLEPNNSIKVLQCQAKIGIAKVFFEVDLANFCDVDAWVIIDHGLPIFEEAENFLSGVDDINCLRFV